MSLQFIQDANGLTTAVVVPIDEWNRITEKYADIEQIPDWQIELGKKELENIAFGNTQLLNWDQAKKQFKL